MPKGNRRERDETWRRTDRTPRRITPRAPITLGLVALSVFASALSLGPSAMGEAPTAAPVAAGSTAHAGSANGSSIWAWGAVANLSASYTFLGAYNSSLGFSVGNLTTTGAYVALGESVDVGYGSYAVVNASTSGPHGLRVQIAAAELHWLSLDVVAKGDFPLPGNYTNGSSVTLAPRNISLSVSEESLVASVAFLNFTTGPNGSLALADEHLLSEKAINVSLSASSFPNVTANAPNTTTLRYVTGAISARAFEASDVNATFTPALTLIHGPLSVGKSWTSNSTVNFTGRMVYAVAFTASSPSGSASSSASGAASANATFPVSITFTVVGSRTVYFPNGVSETDYLIDYSVASGGGGGVLVS
ncbi:MAG: hypothetical protein L3K09_08035, partial [Thermoplasmata archaeon]|nr:hypothetical protein [Thermoplasmata archaeon]